jgi:hypothetical protein
MKTRVLFAVLRSLATVLSVSAQTPPRPPRPPGFGNASAQKPSEVSLDFLKGQEKLHVILNFDEVKLQGVPEKTYLKDEKNQQWIKEWKDAKNSTFKEQLLEHLNKNVRALQCGDYPKAQYRATVRVLTVERDGIGPHLEGPGTRKVACEVVFTKTGNSQPLAKVKVAGDSRTFKPTSTIGSNAHLTGVAFGYVGQDLGKLIAKKIK